LANIYTYMSPLLVLAMRLWPSRLPRRKEIPAEADLHSLRIYRVLDLSLRSVEETQELEDFTETLPGLVGEGNANSREIVSYLRDQDLFGRLGQRLRLSYNTLRTSPDMDSNVRRALSCITTFRMLVERFMEPDASLFPSGSETPNDSGVGHALNVLERLASSEDASLSLQASCTLASMTAKLLRIYARTMEPFPQTDGLAVLPRLLKSFESTLQRNAHTYHNALDGFFGHLEDLLRHDGRLCNLVFFLTRLIPHLPQLSRDEQALMWRTMATLEPDTIDTSRASRWLVGRFHTIWLRVEERVREESSSTALGSPSSNGLYRILFEHLKPLAAALDLRRLPYTNSVASGSASTRAHNTTSSRKRSASNPTTQKMGMEGVSTTHGRAGLRPLLLSPTSTGT
jgi:hypothetical protein